MHVQKGGPAANRLLAALPSKDLKHLLASCETIELDFADVLCAPGDLIRHVYFPTSSFISLVAPVDGLRFSTVAAWKLLLARVTDMTKRRTRGF